MFLFHTRSFVFTIYKYKITKFKSNLQYEILIHLEFTKSNEQVLFHNIHILYFYYDRFQLHAFIYDIIQHVFINNFFKRNTQPALNYYYLNKR